MCARALIAFAEPERSRSGAENTPVVRKCVRSGSQNFGVMPARVCLVALATREFCKSAHVWGCMLLLQLHLCRTDLCSLDSGMRCDKLLCRLIQMGLLSFAKAGRPHSHTPNTK